jgi:hypothetical protein
MPDKSNRGPGRPPKKPAERQATVLQIGLTASEAALIEKAAGVQKPVAWARDTLVRAARKRVK